jgi:hypothetical protein
MICMSNEELAAVYTHLCHVMTRVGEKDAPLLLARFALLAIGEIDDAQSATRLIDAASAAIDQERAA